MKLAIITGGSKGLGAALVAQLAEAEWTVREMSRSGSSAHHVTCDMSDVASSAAVGEKLFADLASQEWEEVWFVDNAGIVTPVSTTEKLTPSDIIRNITINQSSAFALIASFMASFRDHSCRKVIANVSSGAAQRGIPGWSLYCASKAASENFINTIGAEESNRQNPFIAINYGPGVIDTGMQAEIRGSEVDDFPMLDRFVAMKEDGVLKMPAEVAADLINVLSGELENGGRYQIS